jgi:RNA-directed DNA polymerase
MIRRWLTAGVIEKGRLTPTGDGAPQGGVISPLLMNVALHGMEPAARVRYRRCGDNAVETEPEPPTLVRYADLCRARHKSAYAEARVMPIRAVDVLARAVRGFLMSA